MSALRGALLLIVPDARERRRLTRLAQSWGYAVTTHASIEEWTTRRATAPPACALVQMPQAPPAISEITEPFRKSGVPLILLDPTPNLRACVRAVKGGAFDYFALPPDPDELRQSIQEALARPGSQPPAEELSPSLIARVEGLTPRQREVFRLAAAGMPNKQIAAELGISEKTVKIHRFFVMNKLHTTSIAELARVAEKLKLGA